MTELALLIKNIERRLLEKGLTAKDASLRAGLSASYVSQIMTRKSENPRLDQLSKLAKVLGLTVPQMLSESALADDDRDRIDSLAVFEVGNKQAREMMGRLARSLLMEAAAAAEAAPRITRGGRAPPRPIAGGNAQENQADGDCGKVVPIVTPSRRVG